MDGMMKTRSLMFRTMTRFVICVSLLLLAATPLFYLLTKNFYAEDMIDIIEAVQAGKPVPVLDLEADILHGILIQFVLIVSIFGLAIVLMMSQISRKLWAPFDSTLASIESFSLEKGTLPEIPDSDISEFARLRTSLERLMSGSLKSYRIQKEFTENASHELQTPLAVSQSKLDLLLQQPGLTEGQAAIIQNLYQLNARLSRLSRNLLLLAKMDNRQFSMTKVDICLVFNELQPFFQSLSAGLTLNTDFRTDSLAVTANRSLLESLLNNLIANAVRHNRAGGEITVVIGKDGVSVSNTSDDGALDENRIFERFSQTSSDGAGNGLGLAIAKSICDYHGWQLRYTYTRGLHTFTVHIPSTPRDNAGQEDSRCDNNWKNTR